MHGLSQSYSNITLETVTTFLVGGLATPALDADGSATIGAMNWPEQDDAADDDVCRFKIDSERLGVDAHYKSWEQSITQS